MFLKLAALFISALIVHNILLSRFLGCCPFLGVSNKLETAKGMGIAVIFVTTFAAIMTWLAYTFILVPMGLEYLYTLAFILIIAVLGVAVINMNEKYGLIESIVNAVGASAGFLLAITLMAGIRERIEMSAEMPRALRGLPIALITAGLMSVAFMGFNGLIK